MTWADKDTEALRGQDGSCEACVGNPTVTECTCIGGRAADEIERLQARVAGLETAVVFQQDRVRDEASGRIRDRLHAIPRETLVGALRERAAEYEADGLRHWRAGNNQTALRRDVTCDAIRKIAAEIESGAWPVEGE